MRLIGLGVVVAGLGLAVGSCVAFPSAVGSDYAAINPWGVFGSTLGVLLALAGTVAALGGRGGPATW